MPFTNRSTNGYRGEQTDAEVVEMSSNLKAVTEPERASALQRLTASIALGALVVRAAWALIRWGNEAS